MLVCACKGLTDTQIRALIHSGLDSLADLEAVTGITSECGDCRELLSCPRKRGTRSARALRPWLPDAARVSAGHTRTHAPKMFRAHCRAPS